jgi:hypothetical protein
MAMLPMIPKSNGLVEQKFGDLMMTIESPVLSQNDSSEPLVVTPNNQKIPDLTAWIVFCASR